MRRNLRNLKKWRRKLKKSIDKKNLLTQWELAEENRKILGELDLLSPGGCTEEGLDENLKVDG